MTIKNLNVMKTKITSPAILALIALLFSCEQEPKTKVSSDPPPVGEPIEVDSWKIVSSELRELSRENEIELFTGGFNAVLGPRGSKFDLILNSMFHIGSSAGLLSWTQYEEIRDSPGVEEAYPIAVGDNYQGHRLVGTLPELFEEHEWRKGIKYEFEEGGRIFSETGKEALVGNYVARQLGLSVGDSFNPYHGLHFDETKRHNETFTVVGLLKPTGTPVDQVIWIPLKGIQKLEGHDPASGDSISAVLLSLSGRTGFTLDMKYNKEGNRATLVWPVKTVLNSFLGKTMPAYLSFARLLRGLKPDAVAMEVIVEEGLVVRGKAKPLLGEEDNVSLPAESVDKLPPIEEGSVFKPLAFRDLTNFEYLVDWETDGKDFDFAAYSKRVPSRLREKSGAKVAVEGFMLPTVVDENNKVKEFLLLPDQMSCCFGQAPEANGWVTVSSSDGVDVLMDRIIRVTGTLTVEERWDEEFFVGLYHMDCKTITGPAL